MNAYVTFLKITMLENDMYIYISIRSQVLEKNDPGWERQVLLWEHRT